MSDTKREKSSRPFYELPAHIKPCSTIIKETRMQLRYSKSGNLGSDWEQGSSSGSIGPSSGGSGDFISSNDYSGDVSSSGHGFGGIRAVNTQRPFTPRDSVGLWGMSARKRPPSAITLSRLSLDEMEEKRPASNTKLKPLMPKLKTKPLGVSLDSSGSFSVIEKSNGSIKDIEKSRLKLKSLSLVNWENDKERMAEREKSGVIGNKTTSSSGDGGNGRANNVSGICTKKHQDTSFAASPSPEFCKEIDSLEVAVDYLACFVDSSGKASKSDLVAVLKKVRQYIAEMNDTQHAKNKMLKLIFRLVEKNQTDEDILFWASFVLLHCKIIGNNLTTVFKMVFKASRSKEYWSIIEETEYLDVFMESFAQICPKSQTESMIYGYGTLKFICVEAAVLRRVIDLDLIPVMTLHLNILNFEVAQLKKIPESIFNGAFQLTSILRSVVGEEPSLHAVTRAGLLEELCTSLQWTIDDIDVLSNIVRILSVVSGDDTCCELIARNEYFSEAVVKIMQVWYAKDDVIVRLTYCLGNLLAKCDDIRIKLYEEPNAFRLILHLISYYSEKSTPISEDILIKSIRILANWSLNPAVGSEICDDPQLSELLNSILLSKDVSEELLLCVISTLNNISFYKDYVTLDATTVSTAECLYRYINLQNLDTRTEAIKVLGNLTRSSRIRQSASDYVGTLLMSFGEEDRDELLCATVGVFMNIIVEAKVKAEFIKKGGLDMILSLMEVKEDIGLNLMICQVIWNLSISAEDLELPNAGAKYNSIISDEKRLELRRLLKRKLQMQSQMNPPENEEDELPYLDLCQDFQTVAGKLLEKISN